MDSQSEEWVATRGQEDFSFFLCQICLYCERGQEDGWCKGKGGLKIQL